MHQIKQAGKQLLLSSDNFHTLEGQKAAFLSSVFLLLTSFSVFQFVVQDLIFQGQDSVLRTLRLLGIVLIFPLYLLSRRGLHQVAGRAFVWIGIVALSFITLFTPVTESSITALYYMVLPLLISGLVLSHYESAVYLLISGSVIILLRFLHPELQLITIPVLTLVIAVGVTMIGLNWFTTNYQRRAEATEQRYQDLMDASLEAIIIIDIHDARILDMNPAFVSLVGYPREEIRGRYPVEFLTPDTQHIARDMFRTMDQAAQEMKVLRKDGSLAYIETMLRPHVYSGRPALVIVMRDITARTEAERALQESERLFRAIFDNSFQFAGVTNPDGTIREMNSATLRFFNVTHADLAGKKLWEVMAWGAGQERVRALQDLVERAAAGETVRVETSVVSSHNEKAYIDFTITPVFNSEGEVYLLLPEARDITGRYIAEQRRSEYERRYEALFRHTADAVFIIGLDGKIITVNQQALAMLGCKLEDAISSDMSKFVADDEVDEGAQVLNRLIRGETIPPVYTRRMRRLNGEEFIVEINAMLVHDANDHAMYIQSMVRDVTERKRLEQQDFELRLQRARTNLLQHFIDEASHHFRTPIANIKTSNYLLPRFSNNPDKQREHHGKIEREVQRLGNLLDDLLLVTRLQKDDSEYHVAPVTISRMISEVRSYYEGRENYTQHQWKWIYPESETVVIGDKHRISRVVLNVIDNAIRYTPVGGLITIRNFDRDPWTVIEISDTGMGISSEDMKHIFDDFYRGAEAMSRDSTSSGLGLSIAHQIVERHHGAIHVSSQLGSGTVFQIILPINRKWDEPPLDLPEYIVEPDSTIFPEKR